MANKNFIARPENKVTDLFDENWQDNRSIVPSDHVLKHQITQEAVPQSISKELLSGKEIMTRTEVSHNDINNITRLAFLQDKFGLENVQILKESLLTLRVSKDRKSRKEFVESLQTQNRNSQNTSFMEKMFGSKNQSDKRE